MRTVRALPILAALALVPAVQADMFRPSKADQVKLGQRAADDIRRKERVLPASDGRVRLLRRVGSRLLSTVSARNEPWAYSFDVIPKKDLNAFALPGGPIFFYAGIMDKIQTEDELAGILAHELAHIRGEHWANAYGDQQKRQLGLSALLLIFRANKTVGNLASISNDLLMTLPMSRKNENAADTVGMDMMIKAGYNPQGMADVFKMLQRESRGGKAPEFLSTHPNDASRIRNLEGRIQKMNRSFPPQRRITYSSYDGERGW